jgi:16S rRNA (uracil1498-N3)-methyltransferase
MNVILFETGEPNRPLARSDPRASHLLDVLRRSTGDTFDAGVINGPRGKGTLVAVGPEHLELQFIWGEEPPPLPPVTVLLGLPRPQTARKILNEATAVGVAALHFVRTERAEAQYAASTLWSSGEWRRHLVAGAAQAFDTRLPEVSWTRTLAEALALPAEAGTLRLALDNYEAEAPLASAAADLAAAQPVRLALGPERGWGPADRADLRAAGYRLVHFGPRVLRTETALTAALAVVAAAREWFSLPRSGETR